MKRVKLFFFVILLQIFILNNIQFSGYVNPYYYIIFILTIPYRSGGSTILLNSFILGLTIDIFSQTYGMHTFSSVLIGYLKIQWIDKKNIMDNEDGMQFIHVSIDRFIILSYIFILIHHFTLFFLERFTLFCILTTCLFWFSKPSPNYIIFTLVIFFISNYFYEIASIFYNSLLKKCTEENNIGKVSGLGFALGYLGSVPIILICLYLFILPEKIPFGLDKNNF